MSATRNQQDLCEWRLVEKLWSDVDYQGITENIISKGKTSASFGEVMRWTYQDIDLALDELEEFSGDGYAEGSYTLQVFDGKDWQDASFFYRGIRECTKCNQEFETIWSSEEPTGYAPVCEICAHE